LLLLIASVSVYRCRRNSFHFVRKNDEDDAQDQNQQTRRRAAAKAAVKAIHRENFLLS
jgi:hypothetical protein